MGSPEKNELIKEHKKRFDAADVSFLVCFYGGYLKKTMKKYKNTYRIASARAPWWDYGSNASYFVTICCKNRVCYFGAVEDGIMVLSDIGEIAEKCWLEIPEHFPFVVLHNHIIMPNHVHGIIEIAKMGDTNIVDDTYVVNDTNVKTQNFASLPPHANYPQQSLPPKNKFGPQSKNLASILRGFKIGVTKNARKINPGFQWQTRYHDHIIRNEQSFYNISNYIKNNSLNWKEDKFHT